MIEKKRRGLTDAARQGKIIAGRLWVLHGEPFAGRTKVRRVVPATRRCFYLSPLLIRATSSPDTRVNIAITVERISKSVITITPFLLCQAQRPGGKAHHVGDLPAGK